jgi:hypothetical protein
MPMLRKWNQDFFDKWSQEMAYVMGFMFADGAVWCGKRGNWFLAFYSTDLEIIEKIRKVLMSEHKIGIKTPSVNAHAHWKTAYSLQIGSKYICAKLAEFGVIQNKSLVITFPKVPPQFLGDFVRGYFDGDGCVSLGKYWRKDRRRWKYQFTARFTSGSKKFLEGLWLAVNPYVQGGYINTKSKRSGYDLVFGQYDAVALYGLMYNNIPAELFLKRKFLIFREAFQKLNMQP